MIVLRVVGIVLALGSLALIFTALRVRARAQRYLAEHLGVTDRIPVDRTSALIMLAWSAFLVAGVALAVWPYK